VDSLAGRINGRYGEVSWTPIRYVNRVYSRSVLAAVSGADGVAVFEALHRRRAAPDAILHAFDLLELNGKDLRPLPLGEHFYRIAIELCGSAS
jgi:hypothetical protein